MRNQIISGTLMSTQASVTGILVFNRPILLNMVYRGMVKATGGSTRTSSTNRSLAASARSESPPGQDIGGADSHDQRQRQGAQRGLQAVDGGLAEALADKQLIKCSMVRDCGIREICPCISDVGRMAMATSQ